MLHFLVTAAVLCYLVASVLFLIGLFRRQERLDRVAQSLWLIGFLFHSASLFPVYLYDRDTPVERGADFYFALSWALPCVHLLLRSRLGFPIVRALVAPVTAVLAVSSSYLAHQEDPAGLHHGFFFRGMHVAPALLAELMLLLAGIVSVVYLLQDARLKRKQLDSFALEGPSLTRLAGWNSRFVLAGFVAMTLAVLSGAFWALLNHQQLFTSGGHQWVAAGTWLLLGWLVHSRVSLRWPVRRIAVLTVALVGLFYLSVIVLYFWGLGVVHGDYVS